MGLYAGELYGLILPQTEKRLYTFIESDGCFLDGVSVSTGCSVGARTMTVMDFGKIAATFIDRLSGKAYRIFPNFSARAQCAKYAADTSDRWHTYLSGYQAMPAEELLTVQSVHLTVSLEKIIGKKTTRFVCESCGEEIFNGREIWIEGTPYCRSCAGQAYIQFLE